jgi:glutamate dehydrogenase
MSVHNDVADILNKLQALAREHRSDDPLLETFLGRYYREVRDHEADDRRIDEAYAAGVAHLHLGRVREPGTTLVKVLSPEVERDGWETDSSILMFVTDDVPFLVDTVRMVLDRYGLGIHLLVHPMLGVERDSENRIIAIGPGIGKVEAWTQIEIDRCPPDIRRRVEHDVRTAVENVQHVVEDFGPMRERLLSVMGDDPLLAWLGDQNFVFLGAVTYARDGSELTLQEGSELGEYRDGGLLDPYGIDPPVSDSDQRLVVARTDEVANIHRAVRMTSLAIRPPGTNEEYRFVGLLGSAAYRQSVFAIPVIAERAEAVISAVGVSVESHTGRAVRNVVETLPRDVIFEIDAAELAEIVAEIVGLQERRIVRVFDVSEPVGPWTTVLVYVPRSRFTATLPEAVADLVREYYGGDVRDLATLLGTSSLARISMTVRADVLDDPDRLVEAIDAVSTTWEEEARRALVDVLGEVEGQRVFGVVNGSVPADYQARVRPAAAVGDLVHVAEMMSPSSDDKPAPQVLTSFGRELDAAHGQWRFRVFLCNRAATIAELVPMLEHLGLPALDEHPSEFGNGGDRVFLYDLGVDIGDATIDDTRHAELQVAFVGLMTGRIEADGLNRLVLAAGLNSRQVAVLRLYNRYLRQAGFPFSPTYIERAIVRHPQIARLLTYLFDTRFDPSLGEMSEREVLIGDISENLQEHLDAVPSLDDDRICRAFLTLIGATVRTNAFRARDEIAVKLRSTEIPFLPEPRPMFEIFVCSPLLEGVHLRAGRIARGGLRWSDRPEDFRTEVLGLVKAQMVKNAVIVPVGAKGGFVIKRSTADTGDRDAVRAEGVDRYQRFIRGLLDLTDNVERDEVVHPPDTVIYDENDPYLVVAADKGTATFSDIANELAAEYDFWLGDAFASGGSNGYDHKAMAITARGAWESVRRHARVIGKDVDTDELTAAGIGDMSGDVFGNGMLLSSQLKLVAAFDHRHIFLDPNPDPLASFEERQRLFELPRSSWADYDSHLISEGGGVFARSSKSIPVSPQVRSVLGIDDNVSKLRPDDLMSAILRAPVDLLWNGGIGTYVKAGVETDDSVGDRANDSLRVDASELRCRIIGEGGNLGLTQLARVEYAVGGGLIYADAIDNSAGVDCSDHEVNIKIALDQLVGDGELTVKQRNRLLVDMTGEVTELVLDDNRAQTLALMIARKQSLPMVNVHARYLDTLEAEGYLDRSLEYLPSDKQIAERQGAGSGLRTPEFAVMIAYTKNADIEEILATDLPDNSSLDADLLDYFPSALRERFPEAIQSHRLRREIITTRVVNDMVNLAGISFDHRMTEDSGAAVSDVARAFVASRNIFGFRDMWREIDQLGSTVDLDTQIGIFLDARRMAERGTVWLLRHRHPPLDIADAVDTFSTGMAFLCDSLDSLVGGRAKADIEALRMERIELGVPSHLATKSARWPWMHTGFDIIELAHTESCDVVDAATTYWSVFDAFDVGWLWDGVGALPRSDRWQEQARSSLRDDLMTALADLSRNVMRSGGGSPEDWIAANERAVDRATAMHREIRRAESFNLTTLSVALRQLRNLALTSAGGPLHRSSL